MTDHLVGSRPSEYKQAMAARSDERDMLLALLLEAFGFARGADLAQVAAGIVSEEAVDFSQALTSQGVVTPEQVRFAAGLTEELVRLWGGVREAAGAMAGSAQIRAAFERSPEPTEDTLPSANKFTDGTEETRKVTPEAAGRYSRESGEVGRGGIGQVLAARDEHLGRAVAIKEIQLRHRESQSGESDSKGILGRFLREARVTAQLEHPNIVPVYELGQRSTGDYYYTMKLVKGQSLMQALQKASSLEERLDLLPHFVDLCQAIAYAHSRGVIHRDIKPHNVMVGEFGETLVLDWGLAKVRGKRDIQSVQIESAKDFEGNIVETLPGVPHGTPAYMSPEQCEGKIEEIDERSDVWGLGVVLFQILTGELPFDAHNPLALLVSIVRDPIRPVRAICPEAPIELAAVAERALTRDKSQRYQTAGELADEILAFQSGRRVEAHRYGSWELLKKFLAAHRAEVVVAGVALTVLMGVAVAAYVQVLGERDRAFRAEEEARSSIADALAEHARSSAIERDFVASEMYASAALSYGNQPKARGLLMSLPREWRPKLRFQAVTFGSCHELRVSPDGTRVACVSGPEIGSWRVEDGQEMGTLRSDSGWFQDVCFMPDQRGLVTALDDGILEVREANRPPVRIKAHDGAVLAVAVWDDRVTSFGADGVWRVFDFAGKEVQRVDGLSKQASTAAFSSAGKLLAIGGRDGRVFVKGLDVRPAAEIRAHQKAVTSLAFSSDGKRLLTASKDRSVALWGLERSKKVASGKGGKGESMGTALLKRFRENDAEVTSAQFASANPTEAAIIATSLDRSVRILDAKSGSSKVRISAHPAPLVALGITPDGSTFVTAGADRTLRAFEVDDSQGLDSQELPDGTSSSASYGSAWVFGGADGKVRVVSTEETKTLDFGTKPVAAVAVSPNGQTVAAAISEVGLRIFSQEGGRVVDVKAADFGPSTMSFTQDGLAVLAGGLDHTVRAFDAGNGKELRTLLTAGGAVHCLVVSPEGERYAVGGADRAVRVGSIETGESSFQFHGHTGAVHGVAFASDGVLLSGGEDRSLRRLDLASRTESAKVVVEEAIHAVSVLDGRLVAVALEGGAVRFFRVDDLSEVARVDDFRGTVHALAFSGETSRLALAGDDRTVRFLALDAWDVSAEDLAKKAQEDFGLKMIRAQIVMNGRARP